MIPNRDTEGFTTQLKAIALFTLFGPGDGDDGENVDPNGGDWTYETVPNTSGGYDGFKFTATRYDDNKDDPRLIIFGGEAVYGAATLRILWFIAQRSQAHAQFRQYLDMFPPEYADAKRTEGGGL